jgi:hypothetical protein
MRTLVAVLLVAVLMAVTNPSMAEFHGFVQDQVVQAANRSSDGRGLVQAASGLKGLTGFDGVKWYTDQLLASARRDDYIILSVYHFDVDGSPHTCLGVFKHFVPV